MKKLSILLVEINCNIMLNFPFSSFVPRLTLKRFLHLIISPVAYPFDKRFDSTRLFFSSIRLFRQAFPLRNFSRVKHLNSIAERFPGVAQFFHFSAHRLPSLPTPAACGTLWKTFQVIHDCSKWHVAAAVHFAPRLSSYYYGIICQTGQQLGPDEYTRGSALRNIMIYHTFYLIFDMNDEW